MKGNTVCGFWYSVSGFITAYSTWQVLKNKAAMTFLSVLLPTGIADIIKLLLEQLEQWQLRQYLWISALKFCMNIVVVYNFM